MSPKCGLNNNKMPLVGQRRPALPRTDSAVPSALGGLTSGFGMGPGVPPLPWSLTNKGHSARGARRRALRAAQRDVGSPPKIGREELGASGMNETIRKKINKILAAELKNAEAVIRENRELLDTLAEVLMKENHIDGNRIRQIFESSGKSE